MSLLKVNYELYNEANELSGESDRAAAIVGASLLENLLESILKKAMVEHQQVKNMFKGYAPLATFKSKIDLAFFLGLVPHTSIYDDLHKIRETRNDFAHGHKELSFSEESIKNRIHTFNILTLYRKSLQLDERIEDPPDEEIKAFIETAKSPRKMWELEILNLYNLLSKYLEFTKKPTLKENRRIYIAGAENED